MRSPVIDTMKWIALFLIGFQCGCHVELAENRIVGNAPEKSSVLAALRFGSDVSYRCGIDTGSTSIVELERAGKLELLEGILGGMKELPFEEMTEQELSASKKTKITIGPVSEPVTLSLFERSTGNLGIFIWPNKVFQVDETSISEFMGLIEEQR